MNAGGPGADIDLLYLRANGITLHAAAAGPPGGKLVILLHGFPEFWYGWRHQIAALAAAGLRILTPDQRGYNLSEKPAGVAAYRLDRLAEDVLGLADSLGRARFAVVGHDWGGVVAWHLAARNPERVSHAAVLNAPHPATLRRYARDHPSQALKSWYVGFFQLPALPDLALRGGDFWLLRRVLRRSSRRGAFTADDFRAYRAAWARPGALGAMLNWYRALRHDARAIPPAPIRVPVRAIRGDRDAFLDRGLAEAGIALCEEGQVFHLSDATHWVQHERPDEVNRLLIDFLGRRRMILIKDSMRARGGSCGQPDKENPLMKPVTTSLGGAAAMLAALIASSGATAQSYADDMACRQYANSQIAPLQQQANANAVGGTLLGAGLGAALGAAVGGGRGAGIGAASGAIVGTGVGAANAQNASAYLQQQWNAYYAQCMSARVAPPPPPPGYYPPPPGYPPPPR